MRNVPAAAEVRDRARHSSAHGGSLVRGMDAVQVGCHLRPEASNSVCTRIAGLTCTSLCSTGGGEDLQPIRGSVCLFRGRIRGIAGGRYLEACGGERFRLLAVVNADTILSCRQPLLSTNLQPRLSPTL